MSETDFLKLKKHDNVETNTEKFDIENYLNGNWDKIDENVGEVNANISNIKKEQTTQNTDISNIKKEQETQNTNIEENNSKIVELQTEKAKLETELKEMQEDFYQNSIRGQASGEYIHVEDSNNCRAKIGISGNSEQETRSGKNKYNGNDFTRGGWAVSFTNLTNLVNSLAVGDYTISFDVEIASITKEDTRSYLSQISYTTEDVLPKKDYSLTFPAKNVGSKVHFSFQINITNETAGKYSFILYTMGNHSVGPCGSSTYKNIQVELGTQETSYEQYGAMPSPDYPSEIKTVGSNGFVKVTKCNKNILPLENKTSEWDKAQISIINNELTIKPNSSGNLPVTSYGNVYFFPLRKGTTITISWAYKDGDLSLDTGAIGVDLKLDYDDGTTKSLRAGDIVKANQKSTSSQTITLEKNVKSIHWYIFGWNVTNAKGSSKYNLQLEIGSKSTTFEQHKEQSYIMPVQSEMLEEDYFDFDNEEEVHVWNKLTLNGTEDNWIRRELPSGGYRFELPVLALAIDKSNAVNIICDKLNKLTADQTYSNIEGISASAWIHIYLKEYSTKTLDEFKAWLKEHVITAYYKLATPTRLKFTDEQKSVAKELNNARTYKNVTNITTDSIAILDLDYVKDQETQNQKIQNEIDEIKQLLSTTQTSAMLLDNLQKEVESEVE